MFIGHAPAGYIFTKILQRSFGTDRFFILGLIGSILPDADLVYFYFFDHQQTLHHDYWIHLPFYWFVIGMIFFTILRIMKRHDLIIAGTIFFANIFLHLFLDTLAAGIAWFYPFSKEAIFLVDVPARYDFWIFNFVFHWTFLLEIGLFILAICHYQKDPAGRG